jgi:hypothetical protein
MLKKAKSGWKKLDNILADIVDSINGQTPRAGSRISLLPSPTGTTISVIPPDDQGNNSSTASSGGPSAGSPPDGQTPGWQPVLVKDSSCVTRTMYVWGTPPK